MSPTTLTYAISMDAPATHRFGVTIRVRGLSGPLRFRMPAWTPGSYVLREFSRHVEKVRACSPSGEPLPVHKADKACWVATAPEEGMDLSYEVYAHDLTVRTSHLDSSHGFFNGANVFFRVEGQEEGPYRLEVQTPEGWEVAAALPRGEDGAFTVADFDELVDTPVECGPHQEIRFDAGGIPHRWVFWGSGHEDSAPVIEHVTRLIETEIDLFGSAPPDLDEYLFICHMQEKWNGGLEHKASQVIGVDRLCFRDPKGYERFTTLVAHEYFHTWNVKRIRAEGLGPFDYDHEVYTPLLWMMEGITSYYDTLVPARAGLITQERYLEIMGERIAQLLEIPGRQLQSLEEASFDAWIKLYRRDENSVNSTVSYYLKGHLVIFLFDLHIRSETGGKKSFDDVLRLLWTRQRDTGAAITPDQVDGIFEEATGLNLKEPLDSWVRSREPLPFEAILERFGLTLEGKVKDQIKRASSGDEDEEAAHPWMGVSTRNRAGSCWVQEIRRDGPAHQADLASGDELLAIDGLRVEAGGLKKRLALHAPGDTLALTLSRRHELLERPLTLSEAPFDTYDVVVTSEDDAKERVASWLGASPA